MENKLVIEEKTKHAFKFLILELGIDRTSQQELAVLTRAIQYADINNYCIYPLNKAERFLKEMFTIKAIAYFKRTMLNPLVKRNTQYIRDIQEWEYRNINLIKAQYIR